MRSGSSSLLPKSVRSGFRRQGRLDPQCNSARYTSTRHVTFDFSTARRRTAPPVARYVTIVTLRIAIARRPSWVSWKRCPCFTFLHPFPGSWVHHVSCREKTPTPIIHVELCASLSQRSERFRAVSERDAPGAQAAPSQDGGEEERVRAGIGGRGEDAGNAS